MSTKQKYNRTQLDAALATAYKRFAHRSNLTGVDIGFRWKDDTPTDSLCVRIHVERKIPLDELEADQVFPLNIDGVPLDVINGPYQPSRDTNPGDHRLRMKQVMGGISCGRVSGGTGTIGAVVIDNATGRPAILSNWHVMAGPTARAGDPILQPGQTDRGHRSRDEIAKLERWILNSDGDAALAGLSDQRRWLPVQFGTFAQYSGMRDSQLGETLHKSARSVAQTAAKVDGEGIYRLTYEVHPGHTETHDIRGFKLVPVKKENKDNEELSSLGDSGAIWGSRSTGEAVGLHFAGERSAEHAIACNIKKVAKRLDFHLATFDDLLQEADEVISGARRQDSSVVPGWPDDVHSSRRSSYSPVTGQRGWPTVARCPECGNQHRSQQLEDENNRLKRIVADLSLDRALLQDALSK